MALDPTSSDIRDLQLNVGLDGVTVTVGPGVCYIPGTGRIISDGTMSAVLTGALPNTWYHAYAYAVAGGILALELSTTGPSAPYLGVARTKAGDPTRRYLASGRTNASSVLRPGRHTGPSSIGNRVRLDANGVAGSIPVNLLNAFTANISTTVSLADIVPETSRLALIQVANLSNRMAYVSRLDLGAASPTNFQLMAGPGSCPVNEVMLDSNRAFNIILSTTSVLGGLIGAILGGSVMVYLLGYEFDR